MKLHICMRMHVCVHAFTFHDLSGNAGMAVAGLGETYEEEETTHDQYNRGKRS